MPSPSSTNLLVSCPDQPGIVFTLAQVLYGHGANILDADQHTDLEAGIFFQRIRFDCSQLRTDRTSLESAIEEVATGLSMTWRLSDDTVRKRVAIFVSRTDHCLYDLLLRYRAGELQCEISFILSNHTDLKSVADQFGIPFHVLPVSAENKADQESAALELLASANVDLIVLARYMQVLTESFIDHYPSRIINIHHSFLPAFSGSRPYHQARGRGVKLIGATAHYATSELDEGPIIEQDVIRTSHGDSVIDLTRKGRDVERNVLSRAVRWHLEDRVLVYGNKTIVFQ